MKETDEILKALIAKEKELEAKVEQLKDAENELVKVKAAIFALDPDGPVTTPQPKAKLLNGSSYNPQATWKEKIKYVVKLKGHAGMKAIVTNICEEQPELDPEKVYTAVAVNVGDMVKKQGTLKAKSVGGKNEYYLND